FNTVEINNNRILASGTSTSQYGIYLTYCEGTNLITNNYIYTVGSGLLRTGIYLGTSNSGTSGNHALMANNSIQVFNNTSLAYAIDIAFGNDYWDIFNNTVYISGGSSTSNRVL